MKACWTEPRITFENRFWQLDGASVEPKPFQKPYPPLWIGAVHPPAIRRAPRYANGFFGAGSATTTHFAQQVQVLREALAEADQDPSTFQIAKRVYIVIDDDATRAWERANAEVKQIYGSQVTGIKQIYGTPDLSTIFISGPPSACIAGVREIAEAGAELIQFHLFSDEAEQMERLATEVLSAVQ